MQKILTFIITAFVLFAIVKSKLFDFSGINFMSFNSDVEPAKDKVISSEEFKEQYLEGNFWEKSIISKDIVRSDFKIFSHPIHAISP